MHKSPEYFQKKITIDKAHHRNTAYKIQFYNNNKVDSFVENFNKSGVSSKPAPAMLQAELSILNKPEVYKNYQRIINSPYTSNDNFNKMLLKNKAEKDLENIVKNEMERIIKNLDYVEAVMKKYQVPTDEYNKLVKAQENRALANRKQILEEVAVKANGLLVSEGLNIPSNVFSYIDLETSAQSMLRQSQMNAEYQEMLEINQTAIDNGEEPVYTHKTWIWTGEGATTRHESNHLQKVPIDEPFVVVNDKTLDIDEMDYPCDPAGSPSNAYICYCEVEYTNEDTGATTDVLGLEDVIREEKAPSELTVDINETPTVKFLPNIEGLFEPEIKGEFIDTGEINYAYFKEEKSYLLDESDGAYLNDAGKWEYKGLVADKELKTSSGGWWSEKSIETHNYKITGEKPADANVTAEDILPDKVENKVLSDEKIIEPEIIDIEKTFKYGDAEALIYKKDLTIDELTGDAYYKGVKLYYYSKDAEAGLLKISDVVEHNKKLGEDTPYTEVDGKIVKGEPIDYNILKLNEDGDAYLVDNKYLTKNTLVKPHQWELNGIPVDDYAGANTIGTGIISKIKVDEHNAKFGIKPEGTSIVGDAKTQGINNKYIDAMDSIKVIKENGEVYMVDKSSGKKYLYDEKAVYEEAQDKAQGRISYDKPEYDSTAHWGRYGHQILNGLIYGIEKYDYHLYKPYLDKAQPILDKLRTNSKEMMLADKPSKKALCEQREQTLFKKLDEVIDTIPDYHSPSLKDITNAIWEIVYMDKSIMKSPALMQDTFLVRFGHFTEAMCNIGETVKLDGFTSTTYESKSASHFEDKMADNPNRWAILIMADEGTGGIRLNKQFDALTSEREWLLPREQEFEVMEYDKEMRTVVLKVIKNDLYN